MTAGGAGRGRNEGPARAAGPVREQAPTPLVVAATVVIGDTGFASVPLPLGVGTPIGETVFMQWGVLTPSDGNVESSRGLAMTTSLP